MSYILDALRKSELERKNGNIPGVQTVHSSGLNYHNEKNTYWPYLLISAVILNIAIVLYFILDKEQAVTNQTDITHNTAIKNDYEKNVIDVNTTTTEDATEQTDTTLILNQEIEPASIKPVPTPPQVTINKQTDTLPATESSAQRNTIESGQAISNHRTVEDKPKIIDFYNLPESIKQQLPTITISAHVYSSNPLQRSIVINNNFMEEGEYVLDNLILIEITSGGAIFNYHGTLFSYPVISSWQ